MDYHGVARGCGELTPMTAMSAPQYPVYTWWQLLDQSPVSSWIRCAAGTAQGYQLESSGPAVGGNSASAKEFFVDKWSYSFRLSASSWMLDARLGISGRDNRTSPAYRHGTTGLDAA
jgi:hypothetical protein